MIALLGAVRNEVLGVERQMTCRESATEGGWRWSRGTWSEQDVLVVETGMGRTNAEGAALAVVGRYSPSIVISLGFAGALEPSLRVGDIVLCARLREGSGSFDDEFASSPPLVALGAAQEGVLVGTGVTVDRVVTDPVEKAALGQALDAQVVDMESYWIAKLASARQIPFLAVRVVSDTASARMPALDHLTGSDGLVHRGKAALYLASHPLQLAGLLTFYAGIRRAEKSLTGFLSLLVPALGQVGSAR